MISTFSVLTVMTYLHQRYALIGISVTLIMMILGSDGALTMSPINKAVLSGTSRVNMSCASSLGFNAILWMYLPVGGSSPVLISRGMKVYSSQNQDYEINQSGDQQNNLVILNATAPRAGTYYCDDESEASAQLIIFIPKPEESKDNSTEAPPGRGGPSGDNNIIIVGVVGGIGGALLIAAVAGLIYWCLKKKNKAEKYTPGVSEGTVNEPEPPPPPSPSGNNVQVEDQMNNESRHNSTYGTTGQHDQPYIDEDGLHYAQIQLENNPHSRQTLQVAAETIYSDVSFV